MSIDNPTDADLERLNLLGLASERTSRIVEDRLTAEPDAGRRMLIAKMASVAAEAGGNLRQLFRQRDAADSFLAAMAARNELAAGHSLGDGTNGTNTERAGYGAYHSERDIAVGKAAGAVAKQLLVDLTRKALLRSGRDPLDQQAKNTMSALRSGGLENPKLSEMLVGKVSEKLGTFDRDDFAEPIRLATDLALSRFGRELNDRNIKLDTPSDNPAPTRFGRIMDRLTGSTRSARQSRVRAAELLIGQLPNTPSERDVEALTNTARSATQLSDAIDRSAVLKGAADFMEEAWNAIAADFFRPSGRHGQTGFEPSVTGAELADRVLDNVGDSNLTQRPDNSFGR